MRTADATARSQLLDEGQDPLHAEIGVPLQSDEAGPKPTQTLRLRRVPMAPAEAQRAVLGELPLRDSQGRSADFEQSLADSGCPALEPTPLEIFQVNLGKLCNMSCRHCHVDAGPDRTDAMMSRDTVESVLRAIEISGAHTVDITGGAPELHPHFRYFVDRVVAMGKHVIDRCNLTILLVPKFRDLPQWLADRGVEIVASLPHYRRLNTDAQRGDGTFERSLEALRRLNAVGYGKGDPHRVLTLMTNPAGAFLGGSQDSLQSDWKRQLEQSYGITFDRLFALNNMPIARFLEWLMRSGNLQGYMRALIDAFNPAAITGLMCRNTISVSWDGRIYDCDFNQMLEIEAETADRKTLPIDDFDPQRYAKRRVRTGRHCFGCTAGSGSSCAGTTS